MKQLRAILFTGLFLLLMSSSALAGNVPIYRLYNVSTAEHLYTPDKNERDVLDGAGNFQYEGICWYAPESGRPVWRLSNSGGKHLYTADVNEFTTLSISKNWVVDNVGKPLFYSGGGVAIYRLHHPKDGEHLLTTDANEYHSLGTQDWNQEGAPLAAEALGGPLKAPVAPNPAPQPKVTPQPPQNTQHYVLNKRSMKFHYSSCEYAQQISKKNREDFSGTREALISMGYKACKFCKP